MPEEPDLSSLLIAMLRYLGYEANYVTAAVGFNKQQLLDWTSCDNIESAVKIYSQQGREHTTYDVNGQTYYFCNYTYVQVTDSNKTYDLDACFKAYDKQETAYNAIDSVHQTYNIQDIIKNTDIVAMSSEIVAFETSAESLSDGEYALSTKKIIQKNITSLPTSPPHQYDIDPAVSEVIPSELSDMVSIRFGNGNVAEFKSVDLYKKNVIVDYEVSFDSEELGEVFDINTSSVFTLPSEIMRQRMSVTPILKVDDIIISTGPDLEIGDSQKLYITSKTGGVTQTYEEELSAGEMCSIVFDFGQISSNELSEAYSNCLNKTQLINQKYNLASLKNSSKINESNVYNSEYLGNLLRLTGVMYFSQLDINTYALAERNNINCENTLRFGIIGFKPAVYTGAAGDSNQKDGIQKNGQYFVDIISNNTRNISRNNDDSKLRAFNFTRGFTSSELESSVLEEILNVESLSTASLFKYAQDNNIDILTLSSITDKKVSDLNISVDDAKILQAEIDAGNTIITMQKTVTLGNWTGIGFIIMSPDGNTTQYMISGGYKGGITLLPIELYYIINVSLDVALIAESVIAMMGILTAMSTLALGPVALVLLAAVSIEFLVFDILEQSFLMYEYEFQDNQEAGMQIWLSTATTSVITLATMGVGKGISKLSESVSKSRLVQKYGEATIRNLQKENGFTIQQINSKVKQFSKLGISQTTVDTLLKNPKSMFLGDDILSFLGKQGGNQRMLAELVLSNGDDFAKALMKTNVLDDFCNLAWKYGNSITKILPCGDTTVKTISKMDEMSIQNYLQTIDFIEKHRPNSSLIELYNLYNAASRTSCRLLHEVGNTGDDIIRQNVQGFRLNMGKRAKQSNVGYAQISIEGVSNELYAFAYFDSLDEATKYGATIDTNKYPMAWLPKNGSFTAFEVANKGEPDKYLRTVCTEYKILNEIDKQMGDNVLLNGKISLFTEKECCESCSDVLAQFIAKHPNVQIEIIHNNGVMLIGG